MRNAELSLEVASASDAQAKATRIVEGHGGYVASSEDRSSDARRRAVSSVTLVLRVPAAKFGLALSELRKLGGGSAAERINSDDVTEEFIDLEARLRNQRALEQRFLEILKTAGKVEEVLQVEREVASVRTEVDRLEGRRRFLEREAELSTITLSFSTMKPLIRASLSDFGSSIERAYGDSITVGAGIISGCIRFAGLFLPVLMLIGVPAVLMVRFITRRARKAAPGA